MIAQPHRQYDELTSKHIDQLRQLTKQIQDARIKRDNDAIKNSLEVRQGCRVRCAKKKSWEVTDDLMFSEEVINGQVR